MRTFTQNFKITSVIVVLSLSIQGCYTYVPSMSRETDGVYYNPSKDKERTEYLKNRQEYYNGTTSSQQQVSTPVEEYSYEKLTPTEVAYWTTMPAQYKGNGEITIIENPYITYTYVPTYYVPEWNFSIGWDSYLGWGFGISWGTSYYPWYKPWYYDPWDWRYDYWYNPWYYDRWYDSWCYDYWHHHHHHYYPPHYHHHHHHGYPWYDGPGYGPGGYRPSPHYRAPHRMSTTTQPNARRPLPSRDERDDDRKPNNPSSTHRPSVDVSTSSSGVGSGIIRSEGGYYRRVPVNNTPGTNTGWKSIYQ